MVLQFMWKKDFFLHRTSLENSDSYVCNWVYFTQCLTSFPSIDHLLHLCAWFLILFHLNIDEVLSMFLSLENLTSIIITGLPILMQLADLVNSVIIFLSQMILLRCLTFLPRFQTVILIVLLFLIISFFWL